MALNFSFDFKKRNHSCLVLGLVGVWLCVAAEATTLTISDGLGSFRYNDSSFADDSFSYNGSGDLLYQEAWYLNVGGVATILTAGTLSNVSTNSATITYSPTGQFSSVSRVAITYTLTDSGSAGLLSAAVAVTASNSGANFSLINYFDYDLGSPGNDSATFDVATGRMMISDGDSNPRPNVIRQGALFDSWEIGPFAQLQTRIGNGQLLSGSGSPFGPADFTGAMQWNFSLSSNQTVLVNVGGGGSIGEPIPEISHVAPLGFLLAAGLLRRRRSRGGR